MLCQGHLGSLKTVSAGAHGAHGLTEDYHTKPDMIVEVHIETIVYLWGGSALSISGTIVHHVYILCHSLLEPF